jgi:uncharacterized membrane protein YqjE
LLAIILPPSSRVPVLAVVLALLVGGAIGCVIALKMRAKRPPLFSRVIQQLRLDRNSLGEGS